MKNVSVLFVCLGNICRSPTAEGVFRAKVLSAGLADRVFQDSAGTGDWFVGKAPDQRAQEEAARHGYDITDLRCRTVAPEDFENFDYIVPMDKSNLENLEAMKPADFTGELKLLMGFSTLPFDEVPDPYTLGGPAFRNAIKLIEHGCDGLIRDIQTKLD